MAYKSNQLPFDEFNDAVLAMKRKIDSYAPHYPIEAEARDAQGTLIVYKTFKSPFERPASVVPLSVETWDVPVTVTVKDQSGPEQSKELKKVTPKTPDYDPLNDPEQLDFEKTFGD